MKHIFQAFLSNASVPDSSQEHVMEGGTINPEELFVSFIFCRTLLTIPSRMLQYPWGITGGVGIKREDFDCLKPGVYLNDNLIEFGLRYIFLKVFSPLFTTFCRLLQEQLGQDKFAINKDIYIFSPFWFPKFKR